MPVTTRLAALWKNLTRRGQRELELDDEIRNTFELLVAEKIDAGLTPSEAQRAATIELGGVEQVKEQVRDVKAGALLDSIFQDLRYGVRALRKNPGFSAVAVLTLALGIGATTAVLNVVHSLLLRPLPLPDATRLVVLFATSPTRGIYRDTTSFLDFSAWKSQSYAFTDVAAYRRDQLNITGDGTPEPITGLRASHEILKVLGVSPMIGRAFDEEEQRGNHAVAIISHELWTRRFGGDAGVLGRTILLNEVSHAVIGVLPPEFQFPPFQETDVLVPVPERPCRSCGYIRAVARLKPGMPAFTAQQELDTIAAGLARAFPESNEDRGVYVVPLQDVAVGDVRQPLLVLLGAGVFVLLIGCGNVGNVVLARGIARQRELAVRSALGAGVRRLVRQLLTESISLAFVAAFIGVVLAFLGSQLLMVSLSQRLPLPTITFDWALLVLTVLIAMLAGVLSALPVALMVWKSNANPSFRDDGHGQSGGPTERRLSHVLIVSGTALTVMLLMAAGLLVKNFIRLQQVEVGLNAREALTADLMLSRRNAEPARRGLFVRQLLDAVGALPGVQSVAVHVDQPFLGGGRRETFNVEGHEDPRPGSGHSAAFNIVSGDFFHAMDMPVIRGRGFNQQDTATSTPVAVINETMARHFWPQEDAIGKRLRFYYDANRDRWLSVVGVVRDVRYRGRLTDPVPQVFVVGDQPFYKAQDPFVSIIVRTAGDPAPLIRAVQANIWTVDKDVPILNLRPMDEVLGNEVGEPRVYTLLLTLFAACALVIASAGIYGLSAYTVVRRTREIGIRLAVGATPRQILVLVVRDGVLLTMLGVVLGIAGVLALTKVISRFLYGVTPTDAPTFLAVLLLFGTVAFLVTYIPARRATKVDPMVALRCE